MSAVIQNEYTGNGSTTTYSFTFPYLKTSDIKASLDGVDTTAFTLPNATTLQFNTAPTNGAKIKIFRQTSVDNLTATFYAGSAIKSEDLNDNFTQNLYKTQEIGGRFISALGGTMTGNFNLGEDADIVFEGATDDAHETTLTVADPTADRTITLPNVTGTVVTTGDTGTVSTNMIAGDAVTNAKIADDSIDSEHYVDGSIDTQHIANAQVTTAKIADANVTTGKLAADAVTAAKLADNAVVTANIVNANVTTAKIADGAISAAKIAVNSIDSSKLQTAAVVNNNLADGIVTLAKMADDSVGTAELVDGSVNTARLADNSVTLAKMTDSSVGTSEIVDDAVTAAKLASSSVVTASIVDANVTTAKIADDAVTNAKLAEDAVGSTELGDGVIDTVHIGSVQVTNAKLASNSVTTAKITDANVTTAKIANDAVTIGKLGCEQTTLSDSDSHIPTSGAVVDYVAAQLAPLGGFEAIANEQSFPNTQPASGVVISIADAGGLAVSNSGTASGQTVGGTTVNITGIASNFNGTTVAAGIRFLVSSTGSGQNYTYHKATLKEDDLLNLSGDINDFAERYRVGSSNPTSSLDNGDLFFNTSTGKMLVYNGTNTAWEEVQSIGNFFISTLSPAFDGSTQNFTITNAPSNVQQVLLVINGVIQKPNSGTSTPSEGFALDGSTIKLGAAPAAGSTYHAVVLGSTVNIGTPSNNTVTTAILQNDSVTAAKIATGAVGSTELAANAVITSKIADDAVTNTKLSTGCVSTNQIANGAILNVDVNASAAIAGTKISPDFGSQNVVTTGTLGSGNLTITDSVPVLAFVDSNDNSDFRFKLNGGTLQLEDTTNSNADRLTIASDGTVGVNGNLDVGAGVDVTGNITCSGTIDGRDVASDGQKLDGYTTAAIGALKDGVTATTQSASDNSTKVATTAYVTTAVGNVSSDLVSDTSPQLGGTLDGNGNDIKLDDNNVLRLGNATFGDLKIFHSGSASTIDNVTGDLNIKTTSSGDDIILTSNDDIELQVSAGEAGIKVIGGGAVELYHDQLKKLETKSTGVIVSNQGNNRILDVHHTNGDYCFISFQDQNTSGNQYVRLGALGNELLFYSNAGFRAKLDSNGHLVPATNNTYDLGTTSLRWRNIYTNDLNLSNKGSSNDVDGTWGDWTIQEGESDLFLKNNRSGKKYKFNLTEVS